MGRGWHQEVKSGVTDRQKVGVERCAQLEGWAVRVEEMGGKIKS